MYMYTCQQYVDEADTCTHMSVLVMIKTQFSFFSMISCNISCRNPGEVSPAFLQVSLFHHEDDRSAFTSHFSPAFLQEISSGNFLFSHEFLNFKLRQFLHETRNMFLSLQALSYICFYSYYSYFRVMR